MEYDSDRHHSNGQSYEAPAKEWPHTGLSVTRSGTGDFVPDYAEADPVGGDQCNPACKQRQRQSFDYRNQAADIGSKAHVRNG